MPFLERGCWVQCLQISALLMFIVEWERCWWGKSCKRWRKLPEGEEKALNTKLIQQMRYHLQPSDWERWTRLFMPSLEGGGGKWTAPLAAGRREYWWRLPVGTLWQGASNLLKMMEFDPAASFWRIHLKGMLWQGFSDVYVKILISTSNNIMASEMSIDYINCSTFLSWISKKPLKKLTWIYTY